MTIKEIMNINPAEIPEDMLRRYATQLNSAANKRIKRMDERELTSSAKIAAQRDREKFSIRNKDRDQVVREFNAAKEFLNAPTGTVRGARKSSERLKRETGVSGEQLDKAMQAYDRVIEENPGLSHYEQYNIYRSVYQMAKDGRTTVRSLTNRMNQELDKLASMDEEAEGWFNDDNNSGVSQFFK